MNRAHISDRGFTLVEVLVSLFIFSLISLGTMSAMTAALSGKAQLGEATDRINEIEMARALMKSDLASLTLYPSHDPYGNRNLYLISGGVDSLLTFTRTGRDNPGGLEPRGDLQRVSYLLEGGNFIRRTLPQINPVPQTQPIDRVLISGVSLARVDFLEGEKTFPQLFVASPDGELTYDRVRFELTTDRGGRLVQIFELSP